MWEMKVVMLMVKTQLENDYLSNCVVIESCKLEM